MFEKCISEENLTCNFPETVLYAWERRCTKEKVFTFLALLHFSYWE
jgi:hypothetical protein